MSAIVDIWYLSKTGCVCLPAVADTWCLSQTVRVWLSAIADIWCRSKTVWICLSAIADISYWSSLSDDDKIVSRSIRLSPSRTLFRQQNTNKARSHPVNQECDLRGPQDVIRLPVLVKKKLNRAFI